MRSTLLAIAFVTLLPATGVAKPRYSQGLYAEGGLGGTGFLGTTGSYAAPGPAFGVRMGTDLTSWFSLGGLVFGSTHEATVPPPPEREYFQLYHLAADARLTVRVRRIALFAEGSVGAGFISTNVLDNVGVTPDGHSSIAFTAGGGLDYHTMNRHFSFGVGADWTMYPSFDASQSVTVRLYLRYTR